MDATRFDRLARALAWRMPGRRVMHLGSAGLPGSLGPGRQAAAELVLILGLEGLHGGYLAALRGVTPFTEEGVAIADAEALSAILQRNRRTP